ncbi:unnamed protein product [Calicophoron daubneyi]|uniref:DNA polymerase delta subunit 3 n=1 Tax=Calicophoron daubneyi TaxID=300641 RepID=A0AAV2TWJ6_CALDB
MEQQMLFENLDEKLEDETAVITTKWLSVNFDTAITESQRLLEAYFSARSNLSAVYLLSGVGKNGEMIVKLVPCNKLEKAKNLFPTPPSCVIYSVQRRPCKSSSALSAIDRLLDLTTDALKRIVSIRWEPAIPSKAHLPIGEKQDEPLPKTALIPKLNTTGKDNMKTTDVKNFFKPVAKLPTSASTPPDVPQRAQKRPSIFANAPQPKSRGNDNEQKLEDEDEEFLSSAVSKRKRIIVESEDEDEDTPITEKPDPERDLPKKNHPNASSTGQKSLKKRPVTEVLDRENILAPDSETDSPIAKPPRKRRSKKAETVSKSVDSHNTGTVEQASPAQDLVSEKKHPIASVQATSDSDKPHRVRRQVMKTFTDEDGFMVTERVCESASEDDMEPEEKQIQQTTKSNSKHDSDFPMRSGESTYLTGAPSVGVSKTGKSAPRKLPNKTAPKQATKQASLSSFFVRA